MKRSFGPRKTANLSKSTHQQLTMYALAASAAGVGMLVLAQPADAEIIYTPTHRVIGLNQHYNLDLNHDGLADFVLLNTSYCNSDFCKTHLSIKGKADNTVDGAVIIASYRAAFALKRGMRVDAGTRLDGQVGLVDVVLFGDRYCQWGYWCNVKNRYLGLAFKIKGKVHYGWARLNVSVSTYTHLGATLTGYAYETIPGKSIKAGQTKDAVEEWDEDRGASLAAPIPVKPQPATLGALATGAHGLSIWRRESAGSAP
jgi:hypothetical protein